MIAQKPLGSWYVVVLKTSEFSHARNFASGAFGLKGNYPRPELGTQCVCCNKPTEARRHFDPSTDRIRADALAIPVCDDCDPHVPKSTNAGQMLGAGICVGGGLFMWLAAQGLWLPSLIGVAILGICILYILESRAKRRAMAETGHHTGLEVGVVHGLCSVRTTNRRLALEVAEKNASIVHKRR